MLTCWWQRLSLHGQVAEVAGQNELLGTQSPIGVDVGETPDLGQNILRQSSLGNRTK